MYAGFFAGIAEFQNAEHISMVAYGKVFHAQSRRSAR
jgi:hypothetical protein